MKYKLEIKSVWGSVLFTHERDDREPTIREALEKANLSRADLSWADLSRADLSWADLSRADLYWADLYGANLCGANLCGANLSKHLVTPLLMLKDQPGKIRAYKLVKPDGVGPYNGGIVYEVGYKYEVKDADEDEFEQCGSGISVATMDWCLKEWKEGYRILVVEFTAKDIAAIPVGSDGKFRLFRCKVVAEKKLKDLDWPPKLPKKEEK